ncbi:MAG: hypothetical protein H6822_18885 [Planctomycetaceae bacterium]|nr:hypothetical protein [Planctomycetales bacterium]MCB9924254.1 hypothetical protein [Planctomycetaceae bacterium]
MKHDRKNVVFEFNQVECFGKVILSGALFQNALIEIWRHLNDGGAQL